MKKALILLAVVLAGCENPEAKPTQKTNELYDINEKHSVVVIIIDGCQYLYYPSGYATWCTHKGNCNNPIHLKKW
jgi:hypothetical protein